MPRIEEIEHDGEEIMPTAPTFKKVKHDDSHLTPDEKRLRKVRENPTERRLEILARANKTVKEPWLSVDNPEIWTGDQDD